MEFNKYIDHTNLKNTATNQDIEKLCHDAKEYHFASVCIHPFYVGLAKKILASSDVKVCTVVGFPQGMNTTKTKVYETEDAIKNGADEIDMVINVAAVKNANYEYVKEEIMEIRKVATNKVLKVIIETCLLSKEEIIKMTQICNEVGADYIKTSTGFSEYGARVQDVEVMNEYRNDKLQIKASGGIRDLNTAQDMIKAGATRLGTSSGVKLMKELEEDKHENI